MAQSAVLEPIIFPLDDAAREFVEAGKSVFHCPVSDLVPPVVAEVKRLIGSPHRSRWTLHLERPGEDSSEPDDGLIRKSQSYLGRRQDNKWFFHYRSTLEARLKAHGVDTRAHDALLHGCSALHRLCREFAHSFAAGFDHALPGFGLLARTLEAEAQGLDVLRILVYDRGSEIGKPHTDRDGFTFHLADSRPGLRTGVNRDPYTAHPNRVLAFPGDKLGRLTRGRVTPLIHDVVDSSERADEGRWSAVYFSHIPGFSQD